MTTPEEPAPLPTVGERYVLVELVRADDRHEVWRGHDDLASRPVCLTRYLDPPAQWRHEFDERARALEKLSDPGIAAALRHDAADDPPWLATSWVDGESVATIEAGGGFTPDDALAVVGQAAFALAAAHQAGIAHGRLDADHVVVRPDGSVALVGFLADANPPAAADLTALSGLARALLSGHDAPLDPEVAGFLDWLGGTGGKPASDPAEIARTALALARAQRTGDGAGALTAPAADEPQAPAEPNRPWYTEEERKRVRNRLIALGAIVVVGGAILLRIFSSGAGQAVVPQVIGLPFPQAQHQLNEAGFRAAETLTTGPVGTVGTVVAQDPRGGTRSKVGSVVHLTVVTATSP